MLFSWKNTRTWAPILGPRRGGNAGLHSRLRQSFDGLLVYHAARPTDVRNYYVRGLLLGQRAVQFDVAREIFLTGDFPELTSEMLVAADDRKEPTEDGQAFVSLDDRGFFNGAGHYLIYGSESLCGLAAGLASATGQDYRQVLKQRGTPTVFRLQLPFESIGERDFAEFIQLVYDEIPRVRRRMQVREVDFTFRLRRVLPPACVLSHVHPRRVADPLLRMMPYTVSNVRPNIACTRPPELAHRGRG